MKIMVETSALVSISVYWKNPTGEIELKHKFFDKCQPLFDFLKQTSKLEIGIITKTVEIEAHGVLNKAVDKAISESYFPDIKKKIKIMILQNMITTHCGIRFGKIVEECSSRLPIDINEREQILKKEIEPALKEIERNTVRFIQPPIPRFIKGTDFRNELTKIMLPYHPMRGVYKGMPSPRDMRIMTEATMIARKYGGTEKIYVASCDYHFIPNRIQIGSYRSGYMTYLDKLTPEVRDVRDDTARNTLSEKFGFFGEEPHKLMETLKASGSETSKGYNNQPNL